MYDLAKEIIKEMQKEGRIFSPEDFSILFYNRLYESSKQNTISSQENEPIKDFSLKTNKLIKSNEKMFSLFKETYALIKKNKKKFIDMINHIIYSPNPTLLKKNLEKFRTNFEYFIEELKKSLSLIENQYINNKKIIEELKKISIYDFDYGIHNFNYLIQEIKKEFDKKELLSSLLVLNIEIIDKQTNKPLNTNQAQRIKDKAGKLFLKSLRKSDIVAYKNGIYYILLKYSDAKNASLILERLENLLRTTIYYINEDLEIQIDFNIYELQKFKNFNNFYKQVIKFKEKK